MKDLSGKQYRSSLARNGLREVRGLAGEPMLEDIETGVSFPFTGRSFRERIANVLRMREESPTVRSRRQPPVRAA